MVTIPLVNRDIPIIADGLLADPTLGTGCVKVTPAHDPNDYACWQRNPQIGIINILNPDGTINDNGGKYKGLDRYKAREAVVADMEALGLFEGKEDRVIPLKYSDRTKTPIEPYLSDQWFVKMGDRDCDGKPGLAQIGDGRGERCDRVKFFPRALCPDVSRLARRETRLVHQPATVVGASHSGVDAWTYTDACLDGDRLEDCTGEDCLPSKQAWRTKTLHQNCIASDADDDERSSHLICVAPDDRTMH